MLKKLPPENIKIIGKYEESTNQYLLPYFNNLIPAQFPSKKIKVFGIKMGEEYLEEIYSVDEEAFFYFPGYTDLIINDDACTNAKLIRKN